MDARTHTTLETTLLESAAIACIISDKLIIQFASHNLEQELQRAQTELVGTDISTYCADISSLASLRSITDRQYTHHHNLTISLLSKSGEVKNYQGMTSSVHDSQQESISFILLLIPDALHTAHNAQHFSRIATDFLNCISHEIRNPLNCILGFSHLLAEENLTDTQKEYIKHIAIAGTRIQEQLDNLFETFREQNIKSHPENLTNKRHSS